MIRAVELAKEGFKRSRTCADLKAKYPYMKPDYDLPMGEFWLIYDLSVALAAVEAFLEHEGYRRCDIPACNCGSWHKHK